MNELNTEDLFEELDAAFEKSDIKQLAEMNRCEWNYSLTSTPLYQNSLLLIGFNPGAAKDYPYSKQSSLPEENFLLQDLGSFRRIVPFLKMYYPDETIAKIVQINYCLFRSSKESEISPKDKMLCEPIFFKLLSLLKPKQVISFSASLRQHFLNHKELFAVTFDNQILSNKGMINTTVGELKINSGKIPIGFLPHPNYPLIKSARETAWGIVMEKINSL